MQCNEADDRGLHGWCGLSSSNLISGRRKRRQAENIYLDEWGEGVRDLLLKDVGDEEGPAVYDERLTSDEEDCTTSDEEGCSGSSGSDADSSEAAGGSFSASESEDDLSESESEDGDYQPTSSGSESDQSEPSESESSSSEDEPEFDESDESSAEDDEGEEDTMDVDSDDCVEPVHHPESYEGLTKWFGDLEITAEDWSDFETNLDQDRWKTAPPTLGDSQFYVSWTHGRERGGAVVKGGL